MPTDLVIKPNITHKVNARSSVYKIKVSVIAKCIERGENSQSHFTLMANLYTDKQKLV